MRTVPSNSLPYRCVELLIAPADRIVIEGELVADDGMHLERVETYQYSDTSKFPSQVEIDAAVKKIADDLNALRSAGVESAAGEVSVDG